jgi:hypothetical protein
MCTATQVRSLGPSQLAQGAMPALAAALRVALLGRLALASAVPIGHDGLAAAANMAPQACWSAPSGGRVCMQYAGEATCGEDRWCGVVPPEMFGQGAKGRWRGPLEVPTAGHKTPGLIDYGFLDTATCAARPTLDRAPGGGGGH